MNTLGAALAAALFVAATALPIAGLHAHLAAIEARPAHVAWGGEPGVLYPSVK